MVKECKAKAGRRRIANLLPFYPKQNVTEEEKEAIDRHVPNCKSCRAALLRWEVVFGKKRAKA